MAIDRAPWNALVEDDGSNLVGSLWNKAAIKTVLLDPIDALPAVVDWTPIDGSGVLPFTNVAAKYVKTANRVEVWVRLQYPATSSSLPASIANFPFANGTLQTGFYQSYGYPNMQFHFQPGATAVLLMNPATSGQYTNANLSGSLVIFQGSYLTGI